jgi:hypothetical protein
LKNFPKKILRIKLNFILNFSTKLNFPALKSQITQLNGHSTIFHLSRPHPIQKPTQRLFICNRFDFNWKKYKSSSSIGCALINFHFYSRRDFYWIFSAINLTCEYILIAFELKWERFNATMSVKLMKIIFIYWRFNWRDLKL